MKVFINNKGFCDDISFYISIFLKGDEGVTFVPEDNRSVDLSIQISDIRITVLYYRDSEVQYETSIGKDHPDMEVLPTDPKEKRVIQKRLVRALLHDILSKVTDTYVPWGILTGMRPTKVVYQLVEKYGRHKGKIAGILRHRYRISEEKVKLLIDVVDISGEILEKNDTRDCSLYIGIPFCPSTCAYCSFTSYPISKYKDRVGDYLNALEKDAKSVAESILQKRKLKSIYIGGGTPTTLNDLQLERLMQMIDQLFERADLIEFTVEAGRPDTITKSKLEILKSYGVNRISINPQTMNPDTLRTIGRNHSVNDVYKAMEIAKGIGFDAINMDLIVGLPGESPVDMRDTIEKVLALEPDNVTIHTLAKKRGAMLTREGSGYELPLSLEVKRMIEIAYTALEANKYKPYYLYRQKNMACHLENVGFCKDNKESYYNIQIIDEWQDIIAIGSGAVSKKVNEQHKMEARLENIKDVYQYIGRVEEISNNRRKFYLTK